MEAIVFIIFQIFFATHEVLKIGELFNNYSMSARWIWVGYNQSHVQQARME